MLSVEQILDIIDTSQMNKFNRTDFLIYCNYMMFITIKTIPPKVELQPYYRSLYKHVEMLYEDQYLIQSFL
jgi:hypothetical protein